MTGLFTKIAAFFTAIAVAIGGLFCSFKGAVPDAESTEELLNAETLFEQYELGRTIYSVEAGNIPSGELDTVICLQGLVNRTEPRIYINFGGAYRSYLDDMENAGYEISRTDASGNSWTLRNLIPEFRDCITDSGYTLYRETYFAEGLNMACNLAAAEGWLAFRNDKKELAEQLGLTLKADISEEEYNYSFQKKYYEKYRDVFDKKTLAHVNIEVRGLRDFAIQQKMFICYSDSDAAGQSFLKEILKQMNDNTVVFGWGETEKHFVSFLSKLGCSIVPADHCRDNSVLASFDAGELKQAHQKTELPTDGTKHYAAIVFSDGDNAQWVQNGYSEYYRKLSSGNDFPMSWTFPPCLQEIASVPAKRAYQAGTENNYIVSGVSGAAYMNPSKYKESCLDGYADMTAARMLRSDMTVVTILDDKPSAFGQAAFERTFDYFSRYDFITGGLVMLDPDRYSAGKGTVWFSNDKPFVSVRLSLWYPGGEGSQVTNEWIKEQAEIVNSYKADISSVDGYSVINVHPWTVSVENLAYFVSLLDDDVELVTADVLLEMISANVPHNDAKPAA